MVSASVTDAGPADTHEADVDWGDGSPVTERVPSAAQGSGWATLTAAHVYERAGTYDITVTVADDDGGTVATTTSVEVGGGGVPETPVPGSPIDCALCALGTGNGQGAATIDVNGQADWTIRGGVHSNGTFKLQAPGKVDVEPAGAISVAQGAIVCSNVGDPACPPAHRSDAAPLADPLAEVALPSGSGAAQQWQCSGTCTLSPGTYRGPFNHNPGTVSRLQPGTYVFTDDLAVGGTIEMDPAAGPDEGVTLVFVNGASLEIRDQGALKLRPPSDGPLAGIVVAYERTSSNSLVWRGSRNALTGTVYAPNAQLRFDNDAAWTSASRFIVGTVSSQTSKLTIDPAGGPNAGDGTGSGAAENQPPVGASPIVVPRLVADAEAPQRAAPAAALKVDAAVKHKGGHVAVPVLVAVTNHGRRAAVIDTATAAVEVADTDGTWSTLASTEPGAPRAIALTGVGAPLGATAYPGPDDSDGLRGTRIPAGESAVWAATAVLDLNAARLAALLDGDEVTDLRLSVDVSASDGATGRAVRTAADILGDVRTAGAVVENPSLTSWTAQGQTVVRPADLAPGDRRTQDFDLEVPAAPDRATYTGDASYLAALSALDSAQVGALVAAHGEATIGRVSASADPVTVAVDVPVLELSAQPLQATRPGDDAIWRLTLVNKGDATARSVTIDVDGDGATTSEAVLSSTLAPGQKRSVDVSLTVPSGRERALRPKATVRWADAEENQYGPISARKSLGVVLPGRLTVTKDVSFVPAPGASQSNRGLLRYEIVVKNTGDDPVTDVTVLDEIDPDVAVVPGTTESSQGEVTSGQRGGSEVGVALGTIDGGARAVIGYDVDYSSLPSDRATVTNQAVVSSAQLPDVWSDDPREPGDADPTVFTFDAPPNSDDGDGDGGTGGGGTGAPGSGGDGSGTAGDAQIADITPADGQVVTRPTDVAVGTVTPEQGTSIERWTVRVYPTGGQPGDGRLLAQGTGDPSDQTLAQLDPTILPNGLWQVRVTVVDDTGAKSWSETSVIVEGAMKMGRNRTTLTDLTVGVAGLPIQVQRTYDSFDKATGDFGVGWNLELSDFKVVTNGSLGEGGWVAKGCSTQGLIFSTVCYTSSRAHFVAVTWPDGRVETFDLTPERGSTFFTPLTTAKFTGRPGTTSKVEAVERTLFLRGDDFAQGAFGAGGVYQPTEFVLTDRFGTKYELTVGEGLTRVVDRVGNVTTITEDAISSSTGKSVQLDRDGKGRITRVTGPDGASVSYRYDADGDLVEVVNQRGASTTYTYVAGHHLDRVVGPDSSVMSRFEYEDGRVVAIIDGNGNRTEVDSDPEARQEVVTDPGGARTTISTYDADGLLVKSDEVHGGRSHVTEYEYDANRNVVLRRDPTGHEWRATYSGKDITSLKLPSGAQTKVTYDALGQPLTWTDPEGKVITYTWNADGTIASIKDPLGHVERYTYTNGRRTGKVDRLGKSWAWTYSAAGLVTSERDPLGNVTRYEYDASGRRTAVVDPLGNRSETTYDAAGNEVAQKDADGKVSRQVFDDLNRLIRTVDPSGATVDYTVDEAGLVTKIGNHTDLPTTIRYDELGREVLRKVGDKEPVRTTYDGAGNVLTVTDELGRVTRSTYDLAGRLLTSTNPAGGVTRYTNSGDGLVEREEDPLGNVTSHEYWPSGRLRKTTDPLGHATSYEYDALGSLTSTEYPDGGVTSQRYDAAGQLVEEVDEEGDATLFEFDAAGRKVAMVDGEGRRTTYRYDAAGRLVATVAPDGGITRLSHSAGGLTESESSPTGVSKSFEYDPAGRLSTTTDALGNVWSTTYDALGRMLTEREPRQQGSGPATVTNEYDGVGNLVSTVDALGNEVKFRYDDAGQRTSVTDPRGKTWRVTYTPLGEVATETDPLDRRQTSEYDAAGRLKSTTDARGVTVDRKYDRAGRLTALERRGGNEKVEYEYDALGRRTSMTDSSGTTAWAYTQDGATRRVASPAGVVSYDYDRSGLRTAMSVPGGSVSYSYDPAGRLDTLTDHEGNTFDVDHAADGRISSLERPNGVATNWSYDAASRLTKVEHRRGNEVVDFARYTLDGDGNRTSLRTPQGTETFVLNEIDQLVSASDAAGETTTYTYDAAGNRVTSRQGTEDTVVSVYDDASQLVSVDGDAVSHDAAGNVTEASGTTYDWDWLGRMVQVDGPAVDGGSATYAYDGDGVRVSEDSGDGETSLLHDRVTDDGVPDLVQAGDDMFVHLPEGVVETDGAETHYPLADGQGTVRALTDDDGTVAGTTSYNVFGSRTSSAGTQSRFGYTGAQQSGDLVHLNARDLDTSLGRFLSTDPVRPGAPGAVGWNLYTYVANNPTTLVDPTGQFVAGEYGATLRPAAALPIVLPHLAFSVVKQHVLTGAVIAGTAAGVHLAATTALGPDEDAEVDDEEEPITQSLPVPFPLPSGGTNKPRPQDCTVNGQSWYNYWGPIEKPMGADACLTKAGLGTGTRPSHDPPGYGEGYHRGHIIAKRLGGQGVRGNIFTQCPRVNGGEMRVFEKKVADAVKNGETVYYVVALGYRGRAIPDSVSASYAGSKGSAGRTQLPNVC